MHTELNQLSISELDNEKARQIITAGGSNEMVLERDEWQHSAFTKNLLAGLDDWESDTDNDGYVTADELGTYLRRAVTEDSDFQQTPQKGRFRNSGGGEFVFFGSGSESLNQGETSSPNSTFNNLHRGLSPFHDYYVDFSPTYLMLKDKKYLGLNVGWTHIINDNFGLYVGYNYFLDSGTSPINNEDYSFISNGILLEYRQYIREDNNFTEMEQYI